MAEMRPRADSGTPKAVSVIPSGPKRRSWRKSPSFWPEMTSIRRA
jgi:hypothetical protein